MIDALVPGALKLLEFEAVSAEGRIQLLSTLPRRPLRLEFWQGGRDFAEINAIGALVRLRIRRILDPASRHSLSNDLRQFADAVVLLIDSDIEGLVVDRFSRGFQDNHEGARRYLQYERSGARAFHRS